MEIQASTVRILIASDHALLREGLRRLLDVEPGLLVVAEARDPAEARRLTEQVKPQILLLDWAMPRRNCISLLREVGLASPSESARVIILTEAIDEVELHIALELGARGLVLKESGCPVLIRAIRAVTAGEYWVARKSLVDLVHVLRNLSADRTGIETKRHLGLTKREFEIMCAVAAAQANKDIAARFSISEKTVKHHLTNIFGKIGVSNRLELALFAFQHRLRC